MEGEAVGGLRMEACGDGGCQGWGSAAPAACCANSCTAVLPLLLSSGQEIGGGKRGEGRSPLEAELGDACGGGVETGAALLLLLLAVPQPHCCAAAAAVLLQSSEEGVARKALLVQRSPA